MSDDPASAVCYLSQMDDLYAGFAGKDEIAATLRRVFVGFSDIALSCHRRLAEAPGLVPRQETRRLRNDLVRRRHLLRRLLRKLGARPPRPECAEAALPATTLNSLEQAAALLMGDLARLAARTRDDRLCQCLLTLAKPLSADG